MKSIHEINLNKIVSDVLTADRFPSSRQHHGYPSEASVVVNQGKENQEVIGGCLRRSYYRSTNVPETNKPSVSTQWAFALGNAVESHLVDCFKRASCLVDN